MAALGGLARRELVVVTGKGGVGKSAVTATLGRRLAAEGRRTLVLEVDPRENLHQLLGVPPSGGEIVPAGGGLHVQNLKPVEVMDWLVRRQVKISLVVERIKKSPVYQRFSEGAPGLREVAILGHALRAVDGELAGAPPIDTVVLDAPATGHGMYLLTAARLFAETIESGPFHRLASRVDAFVSDPGRTAVVVVTLAEEMPTDEALELREALEERTGRGPELLVVNGLYPPLPDRVAEEDDLIRLWRRRRRVNERELRRLRASWRGPRVELPLLAIDQGATLVAGLEPYFAGPAGGPA